MLPILGYSISDEEDELVPLSEYARKALTRTEVSENILTVVDEACTACVKTNYVVTNLCRGCVGRACYMNCPKGAISFLPNGQAHIDHNKCVNCGICKQACPYHSIVYIPVPCEEACPVKAIQKDENGIEHIDESKCIYCGKCINACPFGSIFEVSQVFDVLSALSRGEQVVAMLAPSVQSQYEDSINDIHEAVRRIGFADSVEVAYGAMETTRREGLELQEKLEEGQPFMTTSCCPSYIELVRKHVPELKPFVSSTGSPMYYTAKMVKEQYPGMKVAFVGPCVGKRKGGGGQPGRGLRADIRGTGCLVRRHGHRHAARHDAERSGSHARTRLCPGGRGHLGHCAAISAIGREAAADIQHRQKEHRSAARLCQGARQRATSSK